MSTEDSVEQSPRPLPAPAPRATRVGRPLDVQVPVRHGDGRLVVSSVDNGAIASKLTQALPILEQFIWTQDTTAAYDSYVRAMSNPLHDAVCALVERRASEGWFGENVRGRFMLNAGRLVWYDTDQQRRLDFSQQSQQSGGQVFRAMLPRFGLPAAQPAGPEAWAEWVQRLLCYSLLTPASGAIRWGDFLRLAPFCRRFGNSRGESIDRVYLQSFREVAGQYVRGTCLEVGPAEEGPDPISASADQYLSLDVESNASADIIGDLCDTALLTSDSLDTIVAFHVLEHIANRQLAVDNMQRLLRRGGYAVVAVPTVQRFHAYPHDYWRPMPTGMKYLFRMFSEVKSYTYGNVLTAVGALTGIASEELPPQAFRYQDPFYPVLSCLVARK